MRKIDKIIEKLQTRKNITEKMKRELDEFQNKINNLVGIKTINCLYIGLNCYLDNSMYSIDQCNIGIIKGDFGIFSNGRISCDPNPESLKISDFLQQIGIAQVIQKIEEFLSILEKIDDFSKYDKSLKELIF